MYNYICIFTVIATCITSLQAMEIAQEQSPLLTENTLDIIHKQQHALYRPVKQISSPHSLPLSEIRKYFCALSDDCKHTIIKTMSTPLLLLSCVAICLPPELVKEHICLPMMDGEIMPDLKQEEMDNLKKQFDIAAEQFYTTPIGQAFDLYQAIKIWLADDTKPIGPVYAMSQVEQRALLGVKLSWYYSAPIINGENEELLNGLSDELKQMYLQDKNPVVLKDKRNLCKAIGAGSCVFGSTLGSTIALGAHLSALTFPPFWFVATIFPFALGAGTGMYITGGGPCCRETNF